MGWWAGLLSDDEDEGDGDAMKGSPEGPGPSLEDQAAGQTPGETPGKSRLKRRRAEGTSEGVPVHFISHRTRCSFLQRPLSGSSWPTLFDKPRNLSCQKLMGGVARHIMALCNGAKPSDCD